MTTLVRRTPRERNRRLTFPWKDATSNRCGLMHGVIFAPPYPDRNAAYLTKHQRCSSGTSLPDIQDDEPVGTIEEDTGDAA